MKSKLVICLVLLVITAEQRIDGREHDEDDADEGEDSNLLATIDCKVGDKYEYMMATQSSLLEQSHQNMLIKAKLEVRCLQKKSWLNQTSGQLRNGQMLEARVTSLLPVPLTAADHRHSETLTIKSGRIQMATLFASLNNMPADGQTTDSNATAGKTNGRPNRIKVGAVNQFFSDFAKSFGELISQLFQKLVKFFEGLVSRSRKGQVRTSGVSWKCGNGNGGGSGKTTGRRFKRQSFKTVNFGQFERELNAMVELPFSFMQLDDGSVVSVQLSPADTNARVAHFKRFLAQAFATQLDDRKRTVEHEQSTLGDHRSHYQREYDEPERDKLTPEQYLDSMVHNANGDAANKQQRRAKRSSASHHLVSVVRTVRRGDMLHVDSGSDGGDQTRNQYRHKTLHLADIEFEAQQVQLVEHNMLVASGGYFHSVLPLQHKLPDDGERQRHTRSVNNFTATAGSPDAQSFDRVLKNYLTMNLEYSMVRLTKNRWRRSARDIEVDHSAHVSEKAISSYITSMRNMANAGAEWSANTASRLARSKRESEQFNSTIGQNVVCRTVTNGGQHVPTIKDHTEREESNTIKEGGSAPTELKECYEYKQFGSQWLNAYFNRSIVMGVGASGLDHFHTAYRLGAQMMGETMFMGQVDVAKTADASKLRVNLFGSEYVDLNLCDIRDKVFSQANKLPLFAENIWFMTNVALNLQYDVQLKVQVPSAACDSPPNGDKSSANNSAILARMMHDQFNLNNNAKIEIGGSFDASFLIFNGEMKLNGNFDMDSDLDFGKSCLSARSLVKPMNVSLDFNYKFFHPVCGEWMEDSWIPKQLSWRLHKPYRNSWFDNVCI